LFWTDHGKRRTTHNSAVGNTIDAEAEGFIPRSDHATEGNCREKHKQDEFASVLLFEKSGGIDKKTVCRRSLGNAFASGRNHR
jgi:hypothetical protein